MTEAACVTAAKIAELGPQFRFELSDSAAVDGPGTAWRSISVLLDGSDALGERYEQVRTVLSSMARAPVSFRVAASTGLLGLSARLLSPAFGAALLGRTIDLTAARWQPSPGGPLPLSFSVSAISTAPTQHSDALLAGPITQLTQRTEAMSLSPQVLWGNVASAVNGVVTVISSARPDLAAAAISRGAELLTHPRLRDAFAGSPGAGFRRRSCCLIYRIAPPGSRNYCDDCVLG